jgi:hypothetical protein
MKWLIENLKTLLKRRNGQNVQLKLTRTHYKPDCTLGHIQVGESIVYTLERPWIGNKRTISCIPRGTYALKPHNWEDIDTLQFSKVWQLMNVPNRDAILIHAGNTVDDSKGCILVGMERGKLHGKDAVLSSRKAIKILRESIGKRDWQILIEDSGDVVLEFPKGENT